MKKYIDTGKMDTRSGFGAGLLEAGKRDGKIVAMAADLRDSVKMGAFAKEFPERFFQCGIAEANMIGAAAGLAVSGKTVFVGSFAEFVTGRVYDQIRQEVGYGHTNVKIASSHAGLTLGEDGATHQTMEDIALMRAIPGMVVINAADYNQTKAATLAALQDEGFRLIEVPYRPTAEHFAKAFYEKLKADGIPVLRVTVYETPDNCAGYEV